MTRFEDLHVDPAGRFSLGIDRSTGGFYLSIPVANRLVDYEEHLRLTAQEYDAFRSDPGRALAFAEACRRRLHDDRLIRPPGQDRGSAT